ncbi:MAG: pseudouridine synthase [Erysipelothrix sp.]|nr:pseudouridine synthase [Erysipelothrix sp.]
MRINNYISSTGYCSRREADELIKNGRVTINGTLALIGQQVQENDIVKIDGQLLAQKPQAIYLILNKPKGITCTTDRNIKGNIIDFINYPERIFPVGRLDKDSEGLILLTNDGQIVNQILAQENNHEKDYLVSVNKKVTPDFLNNLREGVKIYNPVKNEYTVTYQSKVKQINKTSFKITLTQGLNRQIRRMCTALGYQVIHLQRIRIMNIHLNDLPVGKWRLLNALETKQLLIDTTQK